MKILESKKIQVKQAKTVPDDPDCRWIAEQSYRNLLLHFRAASNRNRLYQGETGKYLARTLAAKREELDPDEASRIEAEINAMTDAVEIKETIH